MKITGKSKTAIKALIVLGLHEKRLSVREISEKEDLPVRYLEQLIASLKKQGLVNSIKGPTGGYTLSKPSSEISMFDIVTAVDGHAVFSSEESSVLSQLMNDEIFSPLDKNLKDQLQSITLDMIIIKYKSLSNQEYMYYI